MLTLLDFALSEQIIGEEAALTHHFLVVVLERWIQQMCIFLHGAMQHCWVVLERMRVASAQSTDTILAVNAAAAIGDHRVADAVAGVRSGTMWE